LVQALGILHAGVFGSAARDEARATSDTGVIITLHAGCKLDLCDLGAVRSLLNEQSEGIRIDLVVEPVTRPDLLKSVCLDRVDAF